MSTAHAARSRVTVVGLVVAARRPAPADRAARSLAPMMTVRMLLKSCAMPPASRPIASIFCDCRSSASRSRSAFSRVLALGDVAGVEHGLPCRVRGSSRADRFDRVPRSVGVPHAELGGARRFGAAEQSPAARFRTRHDRPDVDTAPRGCRRRSAGSGPSTRSRAGLCYVMMPSASTMPMMSSAFSIRLAEALAGVRAAAGGRGRARSRSAWPRR